MAESLRVPFSPGVGGRANFGFGTLAHLGSDFRNERKIENREKLEDDSAPSFQDGGNDATCGTSGLISLLHSHNMQKWKRNITKQTNKQTNTSTYTEPRLAAILSGISGIVLQAQTSFFLSLIALIGYKPRSPLQPEYWTQPTSDISRFDAGKRCGLGANNTLQIDSFFNPVSPL